MKPKELKNIIKEAILKEVSNFSDVGISKKQMQTIHRDMGIDHNAEIKPIDNKIELKKAITADDSGFRYLMALDKENSLYFAAIKGGRYDKRYANVYKIDTDGQIIQMWTRQSITKGLSVLTKISKFFAIKNHGGGGTSPYTRDDELNDIRDRVFDFAVKLLGKEFEEIKKEAKQKIQQYLDSDDYKSARNLMNRLSTPGHFSYQEDTPVDLKRLLSPYRGQMFAALHDRTQEPTIRKRAAQLVRKYSEKIRKEILG